MYLGSTTFSPETVCSIIPRLCIVLIIPCIILQGKRPDQMASQSSVGSVFPWTMCYFWKLLKSLMYTQFFFSQNLLVLVFLVQISSKACRERVKSCRLGLWGGMLFVPKLLEGVWLLPVIASLGGEAFQTILKPYSCISHVK